MSRRLKKILIIVLVVVLAITGIYFLVFRENGITGNEWLMNQEERMNDVSTFCDEMDEVFTLYIGGYMSRDDFVNEEILLRQQFSILKAKYEQKDEETKIKTGTHSWSSKKGEEVLSDLFKHIEDFINVEYADMDKQSILANYLILQETIERDVAGYIVLRSFIMEYNESKEDK